METIYALLNRSAKNGETTYFRVFDGWRFVLDGNVIITIERVLPHENPQKEVKKL